MAAPDSRVETITPEMASAILSAKHPNRPVRKWKVDQYAADLAIYRRVYVERESLTLLTPSAGLEERILAEVLPKAQPV